MYGNTRLPGVEVSSDFRDEGSIWRGATESTWFKIVNTSLSAEEANAISLGTIMKEDAATGTYSPISEADISSTLPGARLVIVADSTAVEGASVLVGTHGQVDKARLIIGEKTFTELTDEQKINLNTQLEAWGFLLVNVIQG